MLACLLHEYLRGSDISRLENYHGLEQGALSLSLISSNLLRHPNCRNPHEGLYCGERKFAGLSLAGVYKQITETLTIGFRAYLHPPKYVK